MSTNYSHLTKVFSVSAYIPSTFFSCFSVARRTSCLQNSCNLWSGVVLSTLSLMHFCVGVMLRRGCDPHMLFWSQGSAWSGMYVNKKPCNISLLLDCELKYYPAIPSTHLMLTSKTWDLGVKFVPNKLNKPTLPYHLLFCLLLYPFILF